MKQILLREVRSINGKEEWIEPTLNFCVDELGVNDPRAIIPICLCGRDKLLDGTYQNTVRKTMSQEELVRLRVKPTTTVSEAIEQDEEDGRT
jgi:hypothetical protein